MPKRPDLFLNNRCLSTSGNREDSQSENGALRPSKLTDLHTRRSEGLTRIVLQTGASRRIPQRQWSQLLNSEGSPLCIVVYIVSLQYPHNPSVTNGKCEALERLRSTVYHCRFTIRILITEPHGQLLTEISTRLSSPPTADQGHEEKSGQQGMQGLSLRLAALNQFELICGPGACLRTAFPRVSEPARREKRQNIVSKRCS